MDVAEDPLSIRTGRVGEILRVALPLIAASASMTVKLFCDRAMLARYDQVAIEAAFPAGVSHFMFMTFFLGLAGYAQTFVAQYQGGGRSDRAGLAVWQGIWIALVGGLALATGSLWAEPFFRLFRHGSAVRAAEVAYFGMITRFSVCYLLNAALAGFWSGRGLTRFIMLQGFLTAGLNVVGNWLMIFGRLGVPELGIDGAALATGLSEAVGTLVYLVAFFRRRQRRRYGTWPARTFAGPLLGRLVRFGAPRGFHFFMDIASFNLFVMLMGTLTTGGSLLAGKPQEAINITFAINATAFFPLMGLGQAVAALVGQAVGARRIALARRAVRSAVLVALAYTLLMGALFVLLPGPFLAFFRRVDAAGVPDPAQVPTLALVRTMLWFAAAWGCFDALWIMGMSALQGAGDTRWCMRVSIIISFLGLVLPSLVVVLLAGTIRETLGLSPVWLLWGIFLIDILVGAMVFGRRYLAGGWEEMSVLEEGEVPLGAPIDPIEGVPAGGV